MEQRKPYTYLVSFALICVLTGLFILNIFSNYFSFLDPLLSGIMAIASGLEFMGVKMDAEANNVRGKEVVISAADSKVKVLLIPTNEELMIAMDTAAIVKG